MKLATFEVDTAVGPVRRLGVVEEGGGSGDADGGADAYLDVTAGYARLLADDGEPRPTELAETLAPPEMVEFLRGGDRSVDAAREVLAASAEFDAGASSPSGARIRYDPADVRLLSPLPRPNSIRDYSVFEGHGAEDKPDVWYEMPTPYKGNPDAVVHPGEEVEWPAYDDRPDFELEVAAVVGKAGRNVPAEEADEYVAGYTIFDDFSARDFQFREMGARLGPAKGKDFANGFGPYLVTVDAFDPTDAEARVRVDGEEWASGNVGDMYHSFGDLLEWASKDEGVLPGDVLGSGTVAGCCGFDLDRWVDYGDTVELEVEGLGSLSHRIVAAGST